LANKDSTTKKARRGVQDTVTSSDSDAETTIAAKARKKRERELKRTLQENESLERQLADQQLSKKLNWLS
jgi:hypothetical protein